MKAAEKIRLAIEAAVASGALLSGDIINEAELISCHGVSRTPVREALLQLETQGMLVTRMDVPQLLAMWELLGELEGICARLACERMTADERAELTRLHENNLAIVESGDREAWRAINLTFHELIYNGGRNSCVSKSWACAHESAPIASIRSPLSDKPLPHGHSMRNWSTP